MGFGMLLVRLSSVLSACSRDGCDRCKSTVETLGGGGDGGGCVWVSQQAGCCRSHVPRYPVPAQRQRDACREAEDEMMGWESAISHSSDRIASHHLTTPTRLRLRLRRQHAIPSGWTRFSYEHFFSQAFALYASFNPFPVKGNQPSAQRQRVKDTHAPRPRLRPYHTRPCFCFFSFVAPIMGNCASCLGQRRRDSVVEVRAALPLFAVLKPNVLPC